MNTCQLIQAIYDKPAAKIILNGQKLKAFPLRWRARKWCTLSALLFNLVFLEVIAIPIREEKEWKEIQIGKEEVKLPLFGVDVILWIEDPKDATRKLREFINEFNKVAKYINIQKSAAFLCTKNKILEREIKETIPFTIISKRKKIPRNKATKGDQSWVFFGRTDTEAETPVLWPPHVKSWLIGKDSDAGRDWGQEEKGTTEDEMVGWHHRLNGHEFEWSPGVGDRQRGLACCSSWGRKESDTTERLNWTELKRHKNCTLKTVSCWWKKLQTI